MNKVVVIGLDGATWDILIPLIDRQILPNIKWLKDKGAWGILNSTYPPSTVPAWVSFQTGRDVANHGCFYFTQPKTSLNDFRIINSSDINGITFYELLNIHQKKTIVINLPVSYPPRSRGIMITSFLTPGDKFIFPKSLKEEFSELKKYRLLPNASLEHEGKMEEYIRDVREVERIRFECAKILFKEKEWDFFFILISGTDWIQHVKLEDLINGDFGDDSEIIKAYQDFDSHIGWFLKNLSSNAVMIILSDHGFKQYEKTFCINTWLAQNSYLGFSPGKRVYTGIHLEGSRLLRKNEEKLITEDVKDVSLFQNIYPFLKRIVLLTLKHPRLFDLIEKIYMKTRRIIPIEFNLELKYDPSTSIALGVKWGGIYINDKERFFDGKIEVTQEIIEELIKKLVNLKEPDTDRQIFERVFKKNENGLSNLPDIVCESENYWISDSFASNKLFREVKKSWHSIEGIFLVYGSSIKERYEIQKARIWDIAPTILNIFSLPIPKDIDGRVIKEIFKEPRMR